MLRLLIKLFFRIKSVFLGKEIRLKILSGMHAAYVKKKLLFFN